VHARGYAAHGFFENYKSLSKYTGQTYSSAPAKRRLLSSDFLRSPAARAQSTSPGCRGFAVKLYTQEGNWDIVGNNIPVFFIQDAIKFPDLIHAVKEEPDCAFPKPSRRTTTFGTSSASPRVCI
jgi:catalase